MITKTVDARGRLTLGPKYANRLVILREHEGGALEIIPAEAVPAGEAWLHRNPKALASVRQGLAEARQGRFAQRPDLDADAPAPADDEARNRPVAARVARRPGARGR